METSEQVGEDAIALAAGSPAPLGASPTPAGVNFALYAPTATAVWLVVWPGGREGARRDVALDPRVHRSGGVWHVELAALAAPLEWAWRVDRPAAPAGPPPDAQRLLLDPYGRAVTGAERWGEPGAERRCFLEAVSAASVREPPRFAATDRVVYELCVRGFTAHPSSGGTAPGTFRGLVGKVSYLAELGVTTVELLPVAEWDELEVEQRDPATGEPLRNLWGYSPIAFSAPKAGLAADARPGAAVAELRQLVEALHERGIEVVLDVVFNHTAERDGLPGDPVFSFGGIDPAGYYLADGERGCYRDATGCGNTLACNRPAVVELIVDALRWWVVEVGVDGFRFDLATVLMRGDDGELLADPPLLRRIESEPLLADRVLVAEPWDAGGGHLLGGFARRSASAGRSEGGWGRPLPLEGQGVGGRGVGQDPGEGVGTRARPQGEAPQGACAEGAAWAGRGAASARSARGVWAEWNDRFRDDVRRFVRGEPGMTGALAARLAGSRDLFAGGPLGPGHSINYVTCHDGFTLADLVSYDRKRNERNGEGNRDGSDWNASWSGGIEGPTDDPAVLTLRRRQVRNLLTLLFVAQGVPMLLAGDERGRTQEGNNNAWCQDDEIGWLDWSRDDEGLLRFTRELIAFRRAHPALRRRTFLSGEGSAASARPDVAWHGTRVGKPDWSGVARALAMHLAGEHAPAPDDDIYLAANAAAEELVFELPPPPAGKRWLRVVATWESSPRDLLAAGEEEAVEGSSLTVPAFACVLLRSG